MRSGHLGPVHAAQPAACRSRPQVGCHPAVGRRAFVIYNRVCARCLVTRQVSMFSGGCVGCVLTFTPLWTCVDRFSRFAV